MGTFKEIQNQEMSQGLAISPKEVMTTAINVIRVSNQYKAFANLAGSLRKRMESSRDLFVEKLMASYDSEEIIEAADKAAQEIYTMVHESNGLEIIKALAEEIEREYDSQSGIRGTFSKQVFVRTVMSRLQVLEVKSTLTVVTVEDIRKAIVEF
jgi:hypothetical protein